MLYRQTLDATKQMFPDTDLSKYGQNNNIESLSFLT